jgi:N-acetylneuraminic acid mutarotase
LPRFEAMGFAMGGKLYVMGGFTSGSLAFTSRVDVYDPARDSWAPAHDLPGAQTHAGVAVDGIKAYLVGGFTAGVTGATAEAWVYDARGDSFAPAPSLSAPRAALALVRAGRSLHAIGGLDAQGLLDSSDHDVLPLDSPDGWSVAPPLPNPRNHLGGASVGGLVLVTGGRHGWNESSGNQSETDAYDPLTGVWGMRADLPLGRSEIGNATFAAAARVVVVGGSVNPATPSADVFAYDPVADRWATLTSLPAPRKGAVADVVGNQVIVTTGSPTGTDPAGETWIGCCL